jgi:electron transfer flavoprotein alpha/beta subunit
VLAGARSEREGRGIVGAAVAHHLGAPYLAQIEALTLESAGEVVVTVRGGGWRRRLAVALPVVLTVVPTGAADRAADDDREAGAPEIIRIDVPGSKPNPGLLGTLDRPKRKPEMVTSAVELVRRWRAG